MRYLNIKTLKQSATKLNNDYVIETDLRVENWFKNKPDRHTGKWVNNAYCFVEIPRINTDGTVNRKGYNASFLEKDENGEYYKYYLEDGSVDTIKNKEVLDEISKEAIKEKYTKIINDGFSFMGYWITCTRNNQLDLASLLLVGDTEANYMVYNLNNGLKGNNKIVVSFQKQELIELFKEGASHIKANITKEQQEIGSL